ncbi:hypothetical protein R1sor_015800 [Riccia sorocarpa]|uniref:Transposase n=1 Tax=Riccia sorocarpa TaxID=122646 RepID=A0ABD3HF15_9MARC
MSTCQVPDFEILPRRLRQSIQSAGLLRQETYTDVPTSPTYSDEHDVSHDDLEDLDLQQEEAAMADLFTEWFPPEPPRGPTHPELVILDDDPPMNASSMDTVAEIEELKRKRKEAARQEEEAYEFSRSPIYPGAKCSRLAYTLLILNLQARFRCSNECISGIFRLLAEKILPEGSDVPQSRPEAKKILKTVGMDYEMIHTRENDCILYRNEYKDETSCPKCNTSRYRTDTQDMAIPRKVLRWFPVIPRLQHIFRYRPLADMMTWHKENRSDDGIMRLVVDSPAVQHVEHTWPEFATDPRHIRLGLASYGISPYGVKSSSHSTWPVVLTNYNVPPWLASKKSFLLLTLIIPGPKKVKNFDVYLQPLVEELQQLWTGVDDVYDDRTTRIGRDRWFTLKGILLWTMHDYPGYTQISGFQTSAMLLVLHVAQLYPLQEACGAKAVVHLQPITLLEDLLIHHILDSMHIEANVTKSLIKQMFGEKDGRPARHACEEFGVHPEALIHVTDGGVETLPPAPWVLNTQQRKILRERISEIRFPTGFGSCLRKAFEKEDLREAIYDLSALMRWVCSKEIPIAQIEAKQLFAVETLCKLEDTLPPDYFDSQIHLLKAIHPQSALMLRDREDTHLTSLRLIGQGAKKRLSQTELVQAHTFVLHNSSVMTEWILVYDDEKQSALIGNVNFIFVFFKRF